MNERFTRIAILMTSLAVIGASPAAAMGRSDQSETQQQSESAEENADWSNPDQQEDLNSGAANPADVGGAGTSGTGSDTGTGTTGAGSDTTGTTGTGATGATTDNGDTGGTTGAPGASDSSSGGADSGL